MVYYTLTWKWFFMDRILTFLGVTAWGFAILSRWQQLHFGMLFLQRADQP
jgi:hypothetical protein